MRGKPVICLLGPTASGKTDIALSLARALPVDLISVDSAMVYRDMNIGTAKPAPAVLARYPHALIDIRNPAESFSVAEFLTEAETAITYAHERGRLPLLVGGTMLYFKALKEGFADLPATELDVRAALRTEHQQRGSVALYRELETIDPVAARAIHPNNPQRLLRALEVYRQTGCAISEFWRRQTQSLAERNGWQLVEFAPDVPRQRLHEAIGMRFGQMLQEGFVDEVAALRARHGLSRSMPSMRAVGYRQVWRYLDGELTYGEMHQAGIVATRQLAKRQLTWLRGWPDLIPLGAAEPDACGAILKYLEAVSIVEVQ